MNTMKLFIVITVVIAMITHYIVLQFYNKKLKSTVCFVYVLQIFLIVLKINESLKLDWIWTFSPAIITLGLLFLLFITEIITLR